MHSDISNITLYFLYMAGEIWIAAIVLFVSAK